MTRFSVLICTYQRHQMLRRALTALVERSIEKPDQIVVVNGGDDCTDRVVAEFYGRTDIDLCLIKTINKNLAASRNVGLQRCTGDIVAMTDDDAEVFPDWVSQMKRVHAEHPEAGAVGGAVIGAVSDKSLISRLADVATFPSPSEPNYVRTLPGVNIAYKRDVIDQIGPQDETLFRGEDVDYNWRLQNTGYKIYYDPTIKVLHHHRPTLTQFLYQHYMYGRAYYLVRYKWPEMYCVYPRGLRSPRDFAKLIFFIFGVLYDSVLLVKKFPGVINRVLAYPVLLLNECIWRTGMMVQMLAGCFSGRD